MGTFAYLLSTEVTCPDCHRKCVVGWQFYFGPHAYMPEYHLGDTINWDQDGEGFGAPTMTEVEAVAYLNDDVLCPKCKQDDLFGIIYIRNSVLCAVKLEKLGHYAAEVVRDLKEKRSLRKRELIKIWKDWMRTRQSRLPRVSLGT